MEVFPLEDGASEMGGSTVSQVEQMKTWDASFAQLEKMLQAACETDVAETDENNFSSAVPSTLSPVSHSNTSEEDNKRKRSDSDCLGMEAKHFRSNDMLPDNITLNKLESPRILITSDDSSKLSDIDDMEEQMQDETENYTQLETRDDSFQSCSKLLSADNSIVRTVFQCESGPEIHNENEACISESNNISLPGDNFPLTPFEKDEELTINDEKVTLEDASIVPVNGQIISDTQSSQNACNNEVEAAANNLVDCESDAPPATLAGSEFELKALKPETNEQLENCEKEQEKPVNVLNDKKEKKDKEDHCDKSGKKDDKLSKKKKFERCNIRDIKLEDELDEVTLSAQKEEQERIKRLQEAQMRALQERLQIIEVEKEALSQLFSQPDADEPNLFNSSAENESSETSDMDDKKIPIIKSETDVILLESSDEDKKAKLQEMMPAPPASEENVIDISSSSSDGAGSESDEDSDKKDDDDVLVLSDDGEPEPGPEDPNNSGAHTNDCFNLLDLEGRVLVNVGHPPEDPDIYLAPQIAKVIKPHQIGGIRFLYDNVVENLERYKSSSGFGCILAHSMGLGKTVQVVSFVDVFLRHTPATLVLCIVPINTIQNWKAEFDMWVPALNSVDDEQIDSGEVRPRDYNVYTLNENFKTMSARASLIAEWRSEGGVLLMGYEMYRMLALRKMPKIPVKKGRRLKKQEIQVEPETSEQIKKFMDQMYEHIVIPGPDLVICDEGHRIKNSLASTSMALKSIKTRRRVVLTGYPLQNNLLEYWCMVDFVRPNYLGSRAEFCNMFERPISNGQCIDSTPRDRQLMRFRSHVLHSLLVGFVQRRGHSVLRAVLPKKEEHVLLIRMTTIQRKLYKCFVKDLLYVQQATNPLKLFAVCCKIWNHPDILYKLLQEKKAQEDIDLDIDLSATGSSSTSVTAIRKKASTKDFMKGKHFQRAQKSQSMKHQGTGLSMQKTESPTALCQMPGMITNIKNEDDSSDTSTQQAVTKDTVKYTDLSSPKCKDEYPVVNSSGVPQQKPGHGFSQPFNQAHYAQQASSFCPSNFSQNSMQQLSNSTATSAPYQQQYSSQVPSYGNASVSQQQYPAKGGFSSGASTPQFPPQATNSSQQIIQSNQQQYNIPSPVEQSFPSQTSNSDSYHHNLSSFAVQNNSQSYSQSSNLQTQQYPQAFNQQKQAKSHRQYKQDSNTQQFNMQPSPQPIKSQIPFSQHSQSSQSQFDPSNNISQYQSSSQQFTAAAAAPPSQFNQQSLHPTGQHMTYSEKNIPQISYAEQSTDGQICHDQPLTQTQQQYSDHALPQQFNQSTQQKFPPSPVSASQFSARSQSSQQQFSQSSSLDPAAFSQLSPNPKLHQQSSPQQHFPQQPSPQFSQQMSPLQQFSQCSPSQSYSQQSPSQSTYSQQSPPLQQSPTQQQYSLSSPTHQSYSQSFPQPTSNHQQFGQQQTQPQYPQETSSQQPYSQSQFVHQSTSQYPQHSSPQQQQFPHQSNKQSYGQQFIPPNAQYPRQTSPQQHFPQPARQNPFAIGHQQKFSHQPISQYKSQVTPQYPQQGSHSQFSPVSSQSTSHSQSFTTSPSPTSTSLAFNQQTQSSARQQYSSDQYPLQTAQNKSPIYNQSTAQNVSSPQYTQSSGKSQFPQSSQPSGSPSFTQSPSQNYSLSTQGTCHQGLSAKQYQHPFPQSNQQNSQSSFPLQYQSPAQSCMQPPSQIPSSTHQSNSKQLPVKGTAKPMIQQGPEQMCDSSNFLPQNFQSSGLETSFAPQQATNSSQNVTSSFHSMSSSVLKQENFMADSLKEEPDVACSGNGHKTVTQSSATSNFLPYQQGQVARNPDVTKSENDSVSSFNQDSVTPIRERADSSINYEWAVPIMTEYVLGVLENSHKMMVLFSIIEKTIHKGDKLLVFSQSLSTLDLLEHFLGKVAIPLNTATEENITEFWCRNKNYFRLDGSTSAQEREKLINEFNKNESVSLFLLSTRAGCLGINLVGANRIVVMDASWNPCHDAQAVCRIYRYGQKKQCHIYRLVTDNSLEKRIYDRQVNKQGMSDRVVDELNPESNFTWKDVTTLIQDDEDDGPAQELTKFGTSYTDDVLKHLVTSMSQSLSKEPFEHESLLLDRKDLKLTKQEKKLAKQSYEMAKRANMINIRTTYTYMPGGGGQFIINNKQCQWVGGTTVRVLPGQAGRGSAANRAGTTATPITASPSLMNTLFKQGVMVQKLTIPSTISIPVLTPGAPPVVVPAGQDVLVLRTPKGVYLRLPDGRIIAVQLPPSLLAKTQFRPNVVTHFRPNLKGNSQTGSGRGQSIGIIKQTLQCGGTVRYLGPKNASVGSTQNTGKSSAPEVIELSDDDEPSTKKNNIDGCNSEFESESSERDQSPSILNKTNIFQGKQITIRRVSPAMQQNTVQLPNSKEKCDLPLKLQQNQQITILPINTPAQQSRQKPPPPLAQPVRVQQMLLQPQQGKRKPFVKNSKIQLSSLSMNKNFQKQQITVTPALPIQQPKYRVSNPVQSFQKAVDCVNSPKTGEQVSINVPKSRSSSPILVTEASKMLEISVQAVNRKADSEGENKESNNSISVSLPSSNSLVKAIDTVTPTTLTVTANLSDPMKSSFSSLSEMNHHLTNLMNRNLQISSNSHSLQTQSGTVSHTLPISVSQNLPPSLSVTPITQTNASPVIHSSQADDLTSSFFTQDSQHSNLQLQSSTSSSESQDKDRHTTAAVGEIQITPLLDKNSSTEKYRAENEDLPKSLHVPKHPDSISQVTANLSIETIEVKTLQSYTVENAQNGQLQHDLSYAQQPLTHIQHSTKEQPLVSMPTLQSQVSSKKKKSSRQTSKKSPLLGQLGTQTGQAASQMSESINQFSHSSLSENIHEPHGFQPFSHTLPNSDFQPFQGYTVHKPLLHIQHPQPLHPLQHSQEHSIASHLSHMSSLYPMASHIPGSTPSLSDIQPQPPQAWPVPQSSISPFHPFGQSSQYYSSHENNQFSFQPSSFTLSQPASTHISQPEPSVSMTGLEHVSSSLSSEL